MSPKLRAGKYLLLFHICYYLKIFTNLQEILEIKKNFALAKQPKC